MQQKLSPLILFSVAAPADMALLEEWEIHLLPYQQLLTFGSERHLLDGIPRIEQLQKQLNQADCIVFLLSANFFADDDCVALMQRALQRSEVEGVRLISLILHPMVWKETPLGTHPCLPANGQPITVWTNRDAAWLTCTQEMLQALGHPTVSSMSPAPPSAVLIQKSARLSDSRFRIWIRPFRHLRQPLTWIWSVIILGVVVNAGSSWLFAKNIDVSETPIGWLIEHLWITLLCATLLLLLTLLARLAKADTNTPAVLVSPSSVLTPQRRLDFIHSFQQEYTRRRSLSLQGKASIDLSLQERIDLLASSTQFVRRTANERGEALASGTSITQVYDAAHRGLLLLGAPGAGKTTLLLELVCELLQRAERNPVHPMPVLLNLSSWGRDKLPLESWVPTQLLLAYGVPKAVSAAWMAHDEILFLFDGLDEMETSVRTACINALNTYRATHVAPLILCSRSQEYEAQKGRLIVPKVVEIQPITSQQVTLSLQQAGPAMGAVRAALRTNTILQQLITTPLMLSVVTLTYHGKKPKDLPQMGSPEEQQRVIFRHYIERMLERHQNTLTFAPARISNSLIWLAGQMQQRHLTEYYVEQLQSDWLASKSAYRLYRLLYELVTGLLVGLVTGLLVGLVSTLVTGLQAVLLFGLLTGLLFGLAIALFAGLFPGLITGLVTGLLVALLTELQAGLLAGLITGLVTGLFTRLFTGPNFGPGLMNVSEVFAWSWKRLWRELVTQMLTSLSFEQGSIIPSELFAWSWKRFWEGLLTGLFFGLFTGLLTGLLTGLFAGLLAGLFAGLLTEPLTGVFVGLLAGLLNTSLNADLRRKPNQGIHRSGWNALRLGIPITISTGLLFGLLAGLFIRLFAGPRTGLLFGLFAGLFYGLSAGMFAGLTFGGEAYLRHYLLRLLLWQSGVLPWNVVALLEEATACILLQRVGGGYRFVHPLLQEYFASVATQQTSKPAGKDALDDS